MTRNAVPWPEGVGRRVLDRTDSTMAEAARRAAAGVPGPEWTLALEQTAGRGRRGRSWAMPEGNFAASLLMRPAGTPVEAALRSFVASLALRQALVDAGVDAGRIALKWPNDVLLDGGKVAGILLESQGDGRGGLSHLVVGVGVNLAAAPDPDLLEKGALPAVSLAGQVGRVIAPEAFLDLLARAFATTESRFSTYGFAPIRTAWLAHAGRLGAPVTARTGNRAVDGIFRDIDGQGNLVLDTASGPATIAAGEVFF